MYVFPYPQNKGGNTQPLIKLIIKTKNKFNDNFDGWKNKQTFEKVKGGYGNPFLNFHKVHSFTICNEIVGGLSTLAMLVSQVLGP